MTNRIYFDHCALVVEILLIFSLIIRRMTRGRLNRWALILIGDITIATTADIVALSLHESLGAPGFWEYAATTVYVWCVAMTSVIFCGYLFAVIGMWHKLRENRVLCWLYYIPIVVITVLVFIVNPFTRLVFHVDSEGLFHRAPLIFILYSIAIMYMIVGSQEMLKHRRLFSPRKIVTVFVVFAIMIAATIIQAVVPEYHVYLFFLTVSFLVMVFGLQSPEERMHGATGLFSMNAYVQDINKYHELDAPIGITLSVMTNYNSLIEMLGYFTVQDIISTLARRMDRWVTQNETDIDLYYLGGGRFAVIADERYEDDMLTIAHGINGVLTSEVEVGEMLVKVMNNVCFINFPGDIDEPQFLFAFDERLDLEAYSGELRYAEKLFDKERFELRRDISKVIDRAFVEKLFYLEFQPVYSVRDERYVRAEAFLRLKDPVFGQVRPDLLITEAERTNSIHAITTYVIEEACRFVSMPEFLLLGFDYIEVNLSPVQCMWSDLLSVLLSTVKMFNVQPKNICFNITDVDNPEVFSKMRDNIGALAQVGFIIFMDDFGAGIFEVERIAKMPLSGIKLDRTFVKEGLKDENTAVFEGSLRMIDDLEIDSVAVGVEDEEMEKRLVDLKCNFMQGYHFCRPLDRKELVRFILMG